MTDKEIIIDDYKLEDIKNLLFTGQKMAISTKTFEAIIEQFEAKEQECEELKKTINKFSQGVILPMPEPEIINLADYYKQALKKIEELATNGYLKDSRFCEAKELQQILTIINEVKNNDE